MLSPQSWHFQTKSVPKFDRKKVIRSVLTNVERFGTVLGIRIRRTRMFLGLPDPLVRGMDPAPDPEPSLFS
jgi:hypothetical protein